MPTIFANSTDGSVGAATSLWNAVHDGSGGKQAFFTSAHRDTAVVAGFDDATIFRAFMSFDTSGISVAPASATLKIYGYGSYSSADVIAVKSDAFGGDGGTGLVTGDYNNIDFSTPYSSELATWSTSSYNDITLNATALTDIKNNNAFIVSVIEHDYDYSNSAPSVGTNDRNGMYFDPYGGTSRDPYIDYTLATGYGNTVNGVASANIGKINGVGTANISKINGV